MAGRAPLKGRVRKTTTRLPWRPHIAVGGTAAPATSSYDALVRSVECVVEFSQAALRWPCPELAEEIDVTLLLLLHGVGAYLALNETFRWVKNPSLDIE